MSFFSVLIFFTCVQNLSEEVAQLLPDGGERGNEDNSEANCLNFLVKAQHMVRLKAYISELINLF